MTDPYDVGTISVPAGGTTATGTDTFWVGKVKKNDLLVVAGLVSRVTADPVANGTLAIKPWPGAELVNAAYEIIPTSAGVDVSARLRELLYGLSLVSAGWDAKVPNLAARAAFDDRPGPTATERGFAVMVDDIGTGQAAIYAKQSNANADWSPPALWTGPIGPNGPYTDISFGPVTTLPAGQPATATEVDIGPGQKRIDLGVPKGQDGTGTGDFVGPAGSVAGRLVSFADATGKLGADSGFSIQASLMDTGADRVLRVGAYGFGGNSINVLDWDSVDINGALYHGFNAANAPISGDLLGSYSRFSALYGVLVVRITTGSQPREFLRIKNGGVWQPWSEIYHRRNILGTVSQSSGVPTGAIIERGSNANGEYVRFADGTMECQQKLVLPFGHTSYFRGSWTFPAAFVAAPRVFGSIDATNGGYSPTDRSAFGTFWVESLGLSATGAAYVDLLRSWGAPNIVSGNTVTVNALAKGRWF